MLIAIAVDRLDWDAVIPDLFEADSKVCILETDDETPLELLPALDAAALDAWDIEGVICGEIRDSALFESIADRHITRFMGAGMSMRDALDATQRRQLSLIRDYTGGSGCPDRK